MTRLTKSFTSIVLTALLIVMAGCSVSDPIVIADAAIGGLIAASEAAGWTPGVTYGEDALTAVGCIAGVVGGADTAAQKALAIAACVASIPVPAGVDPAGRAIIAGITAALDALLAAYGVPPPGNVAAALGGKNARVAIKPAVVLHDGSIGFWDRRALEGSGRKALLNAGAAAAWLRSLRNTSGASPIKPDTIAWPPRSDCAIRS